MVKGFSHIVPLERVSARPQPVHLEAGPQARDSIAHRFDLLALDRLEADLRLWRIPGGAQIEGRFLADAVQRCVASGEPVPVHLEEAVGLRFLPLGDAEEEVELEADDLDVMPIEGDGIDLGEAIAQSLALALPAYPRRQDVEVKGLMSEEESEALRKERNPFLVLRQP
ncbi:YceD family protein [Thermaurantiacus sp.]